MSLRTIVRPRRTRPNRSAFPAAVPMIAPLRTTALGLLALATAGAAEFDSQIDALLARMTVAEKVGQLTQIGTAPGGGDHRPEHEVLVERGLIGSLINIHGAAKTNAVQRLAVEKSRLGIPVLFAYDLIHGYRTIFPVPLAEAASWDPALAEETAALAAAEATAAGLRWTYAPMVDIARDPRWGRVVEGAGEDPYLGSVFAAARVRGFQGERLGQPGRMLACAKHWVAYGAAEAGREYNTTDVSEATLREVYFPPFRAALDAGVGSFMVGFNALNGVPASANPFITQQILRGEWGFDGLVISDARSILELLNHGTAATPAEAAHQAFASGVDVEMISRTYQESLPALLAAGHIDAAQLDAAVRRVLRAKFQLGLFARPYVDEAAERDAFLTPQHRAVARRAAARSCVLLKNDADVLPLSRTLRRLAVIGPLADDARAPMGSWHGDGRERDVVTLLAGLRAKLGPGTQVTYVPGLQSVQDEAETGFAAAVAAAQEADAIVVVVGETARMSGEAASRTALDLPGAQLQLVQALAHTGKPLATVLLCGRPLVLGELVRATPALLLAWFPGTEAGHAVADVLFGDVNPGGKLPMTFPRSVGQIPLHYAALNTGRPAAEKLWTSKYIDSPNTPEFPFGFGLSYTRFELSDLRVDKTALTAGEPLHVSAELRNTGARAGDEVVQLYLRDVVASRSRPLRELRRFERVHLAPGETRRVAFTLQPDDFAFHDAALRRTVEPGEFHIIAGTSSVGGLQATVTVTGSSAPQP